jgi:hypothetical protein
MSDTFNDLLASDAAAFKFENIGDTCKGRVVRAERRQQTDPDGKSSLDALRDAIGDQEFKPGGQLAVQYSGNAKKTNPAFSAPKLWTVQYKAPAITVPADEDLF